MSVCLNFSFSLVCIVIVYLNNFMFVITMYFKGLKEDWFCHWDHPRKIKNLLTYLLTFQSLRNFAPVVCEDRLRKGADKRQ